MPTQEGARYDHAEWLRKELDVPLDPQRELVDALRDLLAELRSLRAEMRLRDYERYMERMR